MPSFTIYDLNPEFWAQVQAKAAREGITIKALILRLLASWLAAVLVLSAASGCAPHLPTAPDYVAPAVQTAPASLRLTVSTRSDRQYDVSATVLTADGHVVPNVAVSFALEGGTVTPDSALTNGAGVAQAVASAAANATLTVSAGALAASTRVDGVPSTLLLNAATSVAGDVVPFVVSGFVSGNSATVSTSWTFGDGGTAVNPSASASHRYVSAGSYLATVIATDSLGRSASTSASVTVARAPAPPAPAPPTPPAPPPTLSATLTCTPVAHGSNSSCNVTASYRDTLPSGAITKVDWDWGDGVVELATTSPVRTHNYTNAGTYTVFATVTATTSDGAKIADPTSKTIVIP